MLDASGNKVAESRHYPYGGERWSSGTLPTDYRFTGARQEAYIKLYQMGARWYDRLLQMRVPTPMMSPCLRCQMETIAFVLKVVVSILLSMAALASLLRGIYMWIQLWRAQGESYSQVAFKVAILNFATGALISVTVFLWNPVILVLLVFLGFSLVGALTTYQMVAGPYQAANWLRRIAPSRKSQPSKKTNEESQ